MSETTIDVDLDALAPPPKRVRAGGHTYKLPGDLPMELFFRVQGYEQRIAAGTDEYEIMQELRGEILELFQVHQPAMKKLPAIGVRQLLELIGRVYGGEAAPGEATPPNRAARRQQARRSSNTPRSARATSA